MEFRILGPLEVHGESGAVTLEGTKPRAVLAVLLLHANEPVSAERLALALWGDEAPASAVKTVQVHVSRLRKALGDPDVVKTTPAGYRLRVAPDELDAARFARGVEEGRRALGRGEPEDAAALLGEALALWRGPPLAELAFEPFAPAEIARLEEQRLAALEARVDADLAVGHHAALVSELRQLVAEHPSRERLAAQLMLALYRSGRQAEALEVYREARAALVDDVGIEPGPDLHRLHEAILNQDPSLEPQPRAAEMPPQLDASAAPPLVGRGAELDRLREHWEDIRAGSGRVVTVQGADGIGKSRLVAELAGEVHRAGGRVRFAAGRGAPVAILAEIRRARAVAAPTVLIVDDADEADSKVLAELATLAGSLDGSRALIVATGRDAGALAGLGAHEGFTLGRLDADAVGQIARLAQPGLADHDVPVERLLDASGGVPRRVHDVVRRWARDEAARRVGTSAGRTAAGRAELRASEAELTGDVIALQAAADRADSTVDGDAPVVCPFKGLASFDVADAPYFFGRERLVAELVARLVGAPLLGVVGPSGSGKSSVVRAGLLPALAAGVLPGSDTWTQVLMRPGEHPLRELLAATAGIDVKRRSVIVVDQFEETFTACRDEQERSAFVAELLSGDHGPHVVVLAIRADYYGRCGAYPQLSSMLAAHHVLVSAMHRDELRRAVERPARRAGLSVEPELVEALVADVEREPGALPTLSTALLELWQQRDGRRLRLSGYAQTGGVRGAVARHAEEAFGRLDPAGQAVARRVLLRLTAEGAGGGVERRRVPLAELDSERDTDVARVVALLTDQRLLTISAGDVELAHEALLREWPRLRGWLDEDADGRRLHRHLAAAAREWDERGRDDGELYRGARLAGALEWRVRHDADLNRAEQAFLDAGRTAEQSEVHAARTRRTRALALGVAALVVVAGISIVLAVRGTQRARFEERAAASRNLAVRALTHLNDDLPLAALLGLEAYRREPTVEARSAILSALPALASYRKVGRPLEHGAALEAVAISPDGRTLAAAGDDGTISLWAVTSGRRLGRPLAGHGEAVNDVAFSPDGSLLASAGEDAMVRLWDVATRRQLGPPLPHATYTATSVAFTPNGKILASGGGGPDQSNGGGRGTVRLWDVATRRPLGRPLLLGTETLHDVEFSPDGALLAASGGDRVGLWDVAARRLLGQPFGAPNGEVLAVAFSPNGRTLATAGGYGIVQLWDVRTRRPLGRPLEGHVNGANTVAFSADGSTLASGGDEGTVRLWSAVTHRLRGVLTPDTDTPSRPETGPALPGAEAAATDAVAGIRGVAFGPRGALLASGGEPGTVQLWDLRPHGPLGRPLHGHDGWVRTVAFTSAGTLASAGVDGTVRLWDARTQQPRGQPWQTTGSVASLSSSRDGRTLAVAGTDGTIRIWDARTHRPLGQPMEGHTGAVNGVAYGDGDTLASGGDDGTLRLWDSAARRPIGPPLDAHAGAVNGVAFAPDGESVASAGQDGAVRLWDVDARTLLGPPLKGPTGFVNAVAFSPDGHTLAAAGRDGSVWLWDVDARRPLGPPLTGHSDVVDSVAFSADGKTLATAGADHTVRVWDVGTRHPLGGPLEGHTGWVSAVAFSPDGRLLASAGGDRTIRLWDAVLWSDSRHLLERRVCSVVRRSLSRAEWSEYLPGRPYHATCRGFR